MIMAAIGPLSYKETDPKSQYSMPGAGAPSIKFSNIVVREPNGTKHHFSPDPVTSSYQNQYLRTEYKYTLCRRRFLGGLYRAELTVGPRTSMETVFLGSVTAAEDTNGNELLTSNSTDTLGRTINTTSYYDSSGTQRSFVTATTTSDGKYEFVPHSSRNHWFPEPAMRTARLGLCHLKLLSQTGSLTVLRTSPTPAVELASMTLPSGAQITWDIWPRRQRR